MDTTTFINIKIFEPACEHCGRQEKETNCKGFSGKEVEILQLLQGNVTDVWSLENRFAFVMFGRWVDAMMADPLKYSTLRHPDGLSRNWEYFGTVVDGLVYIMSIIEHIPDGRIEVSSREG
jgi:hypothetical protein